MSPTLSADVLEAIRGITARYPRREAALIPVLHFLQRLTGAITPVEEEQAAGALGLDPIRVREVVTFHTMFRTQRAGTHVIQVCINLSCTIAGSASVLDRLREGLNIGPGETTADGKFTLVTAECLGNCDRAPCLMVDGEDYGPVDTEAIDGLLATLSREDGLGAGNASRERGKS
jgi:NADH:ubiquinone oxidoreductase subunit E